MRVAVLAGDDAHAAVLAAAFAPLGLTAAAELREDATAVLLFDGAAGADDAAALVRLAAAGRPLLGVGAGFAWLCRAGLLPGRLVDEGARAVAAGTVHVRVEGRPTPFTAALPAARVLAVPVGPHAVRYLCEDLPGLERAGQVVLRHCDRDGGVVGAPDGSQAHVAAVASPEGNVVGTLLRPERAPLADALQLFEALGLWLKRPAIAKPGARAPRA